MRIFTLCYSMPANTSASEIETIKSSVGTRQRIVPRTTSPAPRSRQISTLLPIHVRLTLCVGKTDNYTRADHVGVTGPLYCFRKTALDAVRDELMRQGG